MRRVLWILSVAACVSLLVAQLGSSLDYALVPAPTAATTGPQGPGDLVFGLMALVGGGLGFLLSIATGIVGLIVAGAERRSGWLAAFGASGAVVILALAMSVFVLVGLPRNPYDPFVVLLLVPVTSIAFLIVTQRGARD